MKEKANAKEYLLESLGRRVPKRSMKDPLKKKEEKKDDINPE